MLTVQPVTIAVSHSDGGFIVHQWLIVPPSGSVFDTLTIFCLVSAEAPPPGAMTLIASIVHVASRPLPAQNSNKRDNLSS